MAEVSNLLVKIGTEFDDNGVKKADSAFKGLVLTVGDAIEIAKKLFDGITYGIRQFAEFELASKRLADSMRNQGIYTEAAHDANIEYADSLQKITTFSDDAIISTMQLLTTFGLHDDQLRETTRTVLDFASAQGIDLNAAAMIVGKAFQGETGTLARYGIQIDKNVTGTEKFSQVIQQLRGRFAGAAEGEASTLEGKMKNLKNAFDDLTKVHVETLAPALAKGLELLKETVLWWDKFLNVPDRATPLTTLNKDLIALEEQLEIATKKGDLAKQAQINNAIRFIVKKQGYEVRATKQSEALSLGETQAKRQAKIEEDDKNLDSSLKKIQYEADAHSWTITHQIAETQLKLESVTVGTKAHEGYTNRIMELEQQRWDFWRGVNDSIASSFSGSLAEMLSGQVGFAEGMRNIWGNLKDFVIDAIAQMIAKLAAAAAMAAVFAAFTGGSSAAFSGAFGKIMKFDEGGVVPAPVGAPRLAIVHGGETVLPTHRNPNGGLTSITVNVPAISTRQEARRMGDILGNEILRKVNKNIIK